jgi:protein-disulfide isomerase
MEDDPSGVPDRPAQPPAGPGAPQPGSQPQSRSQQPQPQQQAQQWQPQQQQQRQQEPQWQQWRPPGGPVPDAGPVQGPYGPPGTPSPPAGPGWVPGAPPPGAFPQQYHGPRFPPGYAAPPSKGPRALIIALSAFGIVAVLVIVGALVVLSRAGDAGPGLSQNPPGASQGPDQDPSGQATRQPDGSVAYARSGVDQPVLEIYEDFQCPICKVFEDTNGATVRQLVADGKVKVVYRPFQLFTREPLGSNSRRAAEAALCAPAANWVAFHDLLFQNQPPEGRDGFAPADLVSWGRQAGISDPAFVGCVTTGQQDGRVQQATQDAIAAGIEGTPTLKLDGTVLPQSEIFTPDGLRQAVESTQPTPIPTA